MEFYENEVVQAPSILPFIGFLILIAGICVAIYGVVKMIGEWNKYKMMYISSSVTDKPSEDDLKKAFIKKGMFVVGGIVLIIIANFF